MGESARALLGGFIFVAAFGTLIVWFANLPSTPIVWVLRLGLPAGIFAAAALLIREHRRDDLAPDFLQAFLGRPFERNGVCFSIQPAKRDNMCFLNIIFQNQYSSPCHFRVTVVPPPRSPLSSTSEHPGLALEIECEGGAFGVARAPMGIPMEYQGQETYFRVAAATRYPTGRGKLLRFKNGVRVGKANTSDLGAIALTVGLFATGHVGLLQRTQPTRVVFTPPRDVLEKVPPAGRSSLTVLWRPGDAAEPVADALENMLSTS